MYEKIGPPDERGCREWQGCRDWAGYGKTSWDGVPIHTTRAIWMLVNGPIPAGMFICHRCDNPPCCEITHLFLGSAKDNNIDMADKGRHWHTQRAHCAHGHQFDEQNTIIKISPTGRSWRVCRACRDESNRRNAQKRRRLSVD